ncbi:hypothetical protein [Luteimonas saliphila]|uniref:hypothetical protein n=1 Tax=Luteimonas saliphila TaxID=2804919 RepID=UPI00192D8DD8|nr:hypothetical protein [Luteimonas saliphila]
MAADVNLAKPGRDDPARWRGKTLGDVVDASEVERVILLRAATSAPADLDLRNVRRMLAAHADAPLQATDEHAVPWRVRDGIWHAVLLMRSGRVFELEIDADGGGRRGCLLADDGARGCFDLHRSRLVPTEP